MNADRKLICLLSKLQSIFPRDSLLGVAKGGKVGHSRHKIVSIGKDNGDARKAEEFWKNTKEEITFLLSYEWKKYKQWEHIGRNVMEKNAVLVFFEEQVEKKYPKWKIRADAIQAYEKQINQNNETKKKDKAEAVTAKSHWKTKMKEREDNFRNKPQLYEKDPEWQNFRNQFEIQEAIVDTTKIFNTIDQVYSPEYRACKQELKRIKDTLTAKQSYIHELKKQDKQNPKIPRERAILGYIQEDYYVLKKIHDDMQRNELIEINKGNWKMN